MFFSNIQNSCQILVLLIWILVYPNDSEGYFNNELVAVVVVTRHGDRTPLGYFKNDSYSESLGLGQLTNKGKLEHFILGEWLRQRYEGFLPELYSETDIYIRSTDFDRTLMSAALIAAGLYPPKTDQIWKTSMPWQPVPVHTTSADEDELLMLKRCPKLERLINSLLTSPQFMDIDKSNAVLYEYLNTHVGEKIESFTQLLQIFDILNVRRLHNSTLPDWANGVDLKKLEKFAVLSTRLTTFTKEMARLRVGPFFKTVLRYFSSINIQRHTSSYTQKLLLFSAHDSTIVSILNSLDLYNSSTLPPYSSALIFELARRSNETIYVNLMFKNVTMLEKLILPNCEYDCPLETFQRVLDSLAVDSDAWRLACSDSS